MKLIGAAFGVAVLCAVGARRSDPDDENREQTKIEMKDGKDDHESAAAWRREPDGGYMLTTQRVGAMKYALVTDDDLAKHVGHRVEVKGKAADKGDGKVKIETKVGTAALHKTEDTKAKSKATLEGNPIALPRGEIGEDDLDLLHVGCRRGGAAAPPHTFVPARPIVSPAGSPRSKRSISAS